MYESNRRKINWIRIFLILIIIFLILLLGLKCISMINRGETSNKYYQKQMTNLNNVALDYFNKDHVPTEVGKSYKKSLKELIDENIGLNFNPKAGDTCDYDASYIQATRLDTEYQVKTYVKCDSYDDYINTYVNIETTKKSKNVKTTTTNKSTTTKKNILKSTTTKAPTTEITTKKIETTTCKKTNTTIKTTKVVTTKKNTTSKVLNTTQATVKKESNENVTIGFNSNGGNQINSISIKRGSTTNLPAPARTGYTFVGWYKNGIKYTSKTAFTESIILVAEWSKNK